MRFFDVTYQFESDEVVPNATIRFNNSVPKGIEIVPTIYIENYAMEKMRLKEDEYAEKILRRVKAMCLRNKLTFRELQLDCDWTKGTRTHFFRLCEAIKQRMDSTDILSSTIRLHQLIQTPPPVDKGVLMVYNTGGLMEMTTDNSIFSLKDIEPYLRDNRLSKYRLPLDVAFPVYGWSLVFHQGGDDKYYFNRIMRKTDFSSYPQLKKIGSNLFEATTDVDVKIDSAKTEHIFSGYRVRIERPTAKEILEVKKLIEHQLKGRSHNTILYHLDETQLSHYTDNEISGIFTRN